MLRTLTLVLAALTLWAGWARAAGPTARALGRLAEWRFRLLACCPREGMTQEQVRERLGPNQDPLECGARRFLFWRYYDDRSMVVLTVLFVRGEDGVPRVTGLTFWADRSGKGARP